MIFGIIEQKKVEIYVVSTLCFIIILLNKNVNILFIVKRLTKDKKDAKFASFFCFKFDVIDTLDQRHIELLRL